MPLFALTTFIATTRAQVVETASIRYTRAAPDAGGQSIDSQNFGPTIYGDFDDFNNQVLTVGPSTGIGTAEQHSSIDPQLYAAELDTSASCMPDFFDVVNGFADSYYEVTFTVMSSVNFNVSGNADAVGAAGGETSDVRIEIVGLSAGSPSQVIVDLDDGGSTFDANGTLPPGDYSIRARALSVVTRSFDDSSGSASANLDFIMTFDADPAAILGDMDCSGDVNVDDVLPFTRALLDPTAYEAEYPDCDKDRADMNEDASRNSADIALFVAALLEN
ncbi:MAG: hypothetical protein H6818_05755 [Phycisphaerales bacterium]|nr:hypothetical protein [Phycisphaerales bacterium]MCB9862767.1 hypothetical protein [Phycisphaerales bacterium]